MDEPKFAARVEDILRAEDLLEAFADADLAAIRAGLIDTESDDPYEALADLVLRSNQTILALLTISHVAIRELSKELGHEIPETRKFLRVWLLAQMEASTR